MNIVATIRDNDPVSCVFQDEDGAFYARTSDIAKLFEQRHDNLLHAIDARMYEPEFEQHFKPSLYRAARGRHYRCYLVDRTGFALICGRMIRGPKGDAICRQLLAAYDRLASKAGNGALIPVRSNGHLPTVAGGRAVVLDGAMLDEVAKLAGRVSGSFVGMGLSPAAAYEAERQVYAQFAIDLPMAPVAHGRWYSTTELAQEVGLSPQMLGRLLKPYRRDDRLCQIRLTTSAHSGKQVDMALWNETARELARTVAATYLSTH
jgi:hypothetical protein